MKIEFEKLRKTKSFWAIMLFLVFITSTVAITRSLEVGGSVGGINPAEPRAAGGRARDRQLSAHQRRTPEEMQHSAPSPQARGRRAVC